VAFGLNRYNPARFPATSLTRQTDRSARDVLHFLGWGVLAFTVLFWRLGAASFWDPDEAHYAETTRELIASGDWLTPYYNDEPFFDKPILFYLLQAVPMALLGPTETAARAVPALAALAIVVVTWWLGRTLVSHEVGFVAAVLLTANPALFALARYAIVDTVFTALLFGGVSLITVAVLKGRPRFEYGGYVLIGLAVLTKGPLALALSGLTFLVALSISADARRRLLSLRVTTGTIIVLAIAAPWFVVMLERHGRLFVDGYFLKENLLLFSSEQYAGQPPWWFYLEILPFAMLPWTGLIVGRLYDDVRDAWRRRRLDTLEILLWLWVAIIVAFFSLSQFKIDHYIFPTAPALCLLGARAWSDLRTKHPRERPGAWVGSLTVGPILIVAGVVLAFVIIDRLALPSAALLIPAALSAAGLAVTIISVRRDRPPVVPWISAGAMACLYAGTLLWVVPAFEERKVVPDIARWIAARAGPDDRVAAYLLNRWSTAFRFYVGRHTTFLQGPDTAPNFFSAPEPFYVAMLQPAYEEFVARGIPLKVVYAREGMWVTTGRALWREKEAPTRFVVVTRASRD
jgi:4-amino-4-deoxy-L-arabinose transferase-like glycosyltransferase